MVRRRRQRGSTLLLVLALLVIAIPIFALLIHTGLTTLTRRQMQSAVDSAAIEGLRLRDDASVPTEEVRRALVRDRVSQIFDDDLLASSDDAMDFGAGPETPLVDGIVLPDTEFRASRRIDVENLGVYKPRLQANVGDLAHGDMVAGRYDTGDRMHSENGTYARTDFASPVDPSEEDAFLVRLRRTTPPDASAPSQDSEPGVSSTGPTVPFLFGRAPWGGPEYLNRRERGTIVRATAIAQAQPAVVVGVASEDMPYGLAPYWIERSSWGALPAETPASVSIAGGVISGVVAGTFIEPEIATLGMTLTASGSSSGVPEERYVAIYDEFEGVPRIIGFGTASLDVAEGTIVKLLSAVAPSNASAQYVVPFPALSGTEASAVFDAHRSFAAAAESEALLVPSLVRSVR